MSIQAQMQSVVRKVGDTIPESRNTYLMDDVIVTVESAEVWKANKAKQMRLTMSQNEINQFPQMIQQFPSLLAERF